MKRSKEEFDRIRVEMESGLKKLEDVSGTFTEGSEEYNSLERGALLYLYICSQKTNNAFLNFLKSQPMPLSDYQWVLIKRGEGVLHIKEKAVVYKDLHKEHYDRFKNDMYKMKETLAVLAVGIEDEKTRNLMRQIAGLITGDCPGETLMQEFFYWMENKVVPPEDLLISK